MIAMIIRIKRLKTHEKENGWEAGGYVFWEKKICKKPMEMRDRSRMVRAEE